MSKKGIFSTDSKAQLRHERSKRFAVSMMIKKDMEEKQYTEENISGLLEFRAVSKKIRRAGGRTMGNPKRTREQDHSFENALRQLITKAKMSL